MFRRSFWLRSWRTVLASACLIGTSAFVATSQNGAGASSTPYQIGLITTVNNPNVSLPDYVAADRAAVLAINKAGGVNGHPLQLDFCDGETEANIEGQCARQMVSDKVIAIAGGLWINSPDVDPVLDAAGISRIGINTLAPSQENDKYYFMMDPGSTALYQGDLYGLKERGVKSVYVDVLNEPSFTSSLSQWSTLGNAIGIKVLGTAVVPPTATDLTPQAQQVASSGAQGAIIAASGTTIDAFLTAMKTVAPNVVLADGPVEVSPSNAAQLGAAGQGLIATAPYPPFSDKSDPVVQEYLKQLKAEAATGNKYATLHYQDSLDMEGWSAVYAIAKVAEGLKTVNASTVYNGFKSVHNLSVGAVVDWNPNGPGLPGLSRATYQTLYPVQVKDGTAYLLKGGSFNFAKVFKLNS